MGSSATVHVPGEAPREIAIAPGAAADVDGAVRLHGSEAPGVVVEVLRGSARIGGARARAGDRLLLAPGRTARAGAVRVVAGWRDAGTATAARALLGSALRGEARVPGPALVVLSGPAAGRSLPLRAGILGRGPGSALHLPDAAVSRAHARIAVDGDDVRVADLGSRNGTWIDRGRVRGLRPLPPGGRLRAGRTVLVLSLAGAAAVERNPPEASGPPATRRASRVLLVLAGVAAALAAASC